jgi:hypothetical protein
MGKARVLVNQAPLFERKPFQGKAMREIRQGGLELALRSRDSQ